MPLLKGPPEQSPHARAHAQNFVDSQEVSMSASLLSVEQMAARLGVSKSTVYALAKQRKIPHLRIGDRVLFNPEKVETALEIASEADRPLVIGTKGRRYGTKNQ
jgi:excisionase family DNA binding protein